LHVTTLDYSILALYFVVVLGVGVVVKSRMRRSSDFLLAGRTIPAWAAGLAFIAANLGAQEVIGMAASGAKYGFLTSHFYWIGAIPAMAFVGVFMMPFYYGSRARSVPEYLRLRFDEKTRTLNALTFAIMTILSSGISLFAMGKLFNILLGWNMHVSFAVAALVVLGYIVLGGLTSAIYNEVLQFGLIVCGFLPLAWIGLRDVGGWSGLADRLPATYTHIWSFMGQADANPLGVEWFGMVMGLGFVLSFGYWCTDFLVVQRAMAAESEHAARCTPLIGAIPKVFFPFIVILPGLAAMALSTHPAAGTAPLLPRLADGTWDYNMAIPAMLAHFYPAGMLGVGLTALMASFMSGMAGNVTAFNTVWTYDLYQGHINRNASDAHYLWMARYATAAGVVLSVATAYIAMRFNNIMDMLQLVFSFVNAPLLATFLLGMFWRRTTGDGAFWGLIGGTLGAAAHYEVTAVQGSASLLPKLAIWHVYPSDMAQNFWGAIWAWGLCFVLTIAISLVTSPRKREDLVGLVHGLGSHTGDGMADRDRPWFARPSVLAVIVLAITAMLNIIFW
jgi:SSS family solute:Na+ symporter